jgi:hypothetical protein
MERAYRRDADISRAVEFSLPEERAVPRNTAESPTMRVIRKRTIISSRRVNPDEFPLNKGGQGVVFPLRALRQPPSPPLLRGNEERTAD